MKEIIHIAHYFKIMVYIGLFVIFRAISKVIFFFFNIKNLTISTFFQVCRPERASSVISEIVLVMLKQQPLVK